MIKTSAIVLSAGLAVAALSPTAARADAEGEALAFVIGAAVGHAISDRDVHVRHVHRVHRPDARWYYHRGHPAKWRFHGYDRRDFKHRHFKHDRRDHRRHERRHDRRDARRDDRRKDRRDDRRERGWGGRHS